MDTSLTRTLSTDGWFSKLLSLLGPLMNYGTFYVGCPKRDPNFDNYPDECLQSPPFNLRSVLYRNFAEVVVVTWNKMANDVSLGLP